MLDNTKTIEDKQTLVGVDSHATASELRAGAPVPQLGVCSRKMREYFNLAGLILRSSAGTSGIPADSDRAWAAHVIDIGISECWPCR